VLEQVVRGRSRWGRKPVVLSGQTVADSAEQVITTVFCGTGSTLSPFGTCRRSDRAGPRSRVNCRDAACPSDPPSSPPIVVFVFSCLARTGRALDLDRLEEDIPARLGVLRQPPQCARAARRGSSWRRRTTDSHGRRHKRSLEVVELELCGAADDLGRLLRVVDPASWITIWSVPCLRISATPRPACRPGSA